MKWGRLPWRKIYRKYEYNTALHRYEEQIVVRKLAELHQRDHPARISYTPDMLDREFPGLFRMSYLHKVLRRLNQAGAVKRERTAFFRSAYAYQLREEVTDGRHLQRAEAG